MLMVGDSTPVIEAFSGHRCLDFFPRGQPRGVTCKGNEKCIPIGRMQVAEDLVGTAIFLASDASTYITGQTIHVNGGFLMVD